MGSGGSVVLAVAGEVDPTTALVSLVTYGPLGIICAFLLWRGREKDREHAAERQRDRDEDGERWGQVLSELREWGQILQRIETRLEERKPP